MATLKKTELEAPAGATAFRDTVFTSRTLILPDGRSLLVTQSRVIAGPGDTIALEYLQGHPDLQQE